MDTEPTMLNIALNDLANQTLNAVPYEPSASTSQAIDDLSERLGQSSLFIGLALAEVAAAIRESDSEVATAIRELASAVRIQRFV